MSALLLPFEVRSGPQRYPRGTQRSPEVPRGTQSGSRVTRAELERRARVLFAERPEATYGEIAEASGLDAVELVAVLHPGGRS